MRQNFRDTKLGFVARPEVAALNAARVVVVAHAALAESAVSAAVASAANAEPALADVVVAPPVLRAEFATFAVSFEVPAVRAVRAADVAQVACVAEAPVANVVAARNVVAVVAPA